MEHTEKRKGKGKGHCVDTKETKKTKLTKYLESCSSWCACACCSFLISLRLKNEVYGAWGICCAYGKEESERKRKKGRTKRAQYDMSIFHCTILRIVIYEMR